MMTAPRPSNGAFRSVVVRVGGRTSRSWFGPAFPLLAALSRSSALPRPEIRLGLFDCLCLVLLVLIGIGTLPNVVWLPYAAVILLPAGLARWSPESGSSRLRLLLQASVVAGSDRARPARLADDDARAERPVARCTGGGDRARDDGRPVAP